jgi:hypothetical protein
MGRHVARVSIPELNFGSTEITSPLINRGRTEEANEQVLNFHLNPIDSGDGSIGPRNSPRTRNCRVTR